MRFFSFRKLFFLAALAASGLIVYAYYLQAVVGLEPCPLCIFQRIGFILIALIMFIGAVHDPQATGRKLYAVVASLLSMMGAAIAGYHIWLRNLPPDQVPACGPSLSYMLESFPVSKMLKQVFTGSGECAVSDGWKFLSLDMPTWALIWFLGLSLVAIYAGFFAGGKVVRK